jgi:hypothetical protein
MAKDRVVPEGQPRIDQRFSAGSGVWTFSGPRGRDKPAQAKRVRERRPGFVPQLARAPKGPQRGETTVSPSAIADVPTMLIRLSHFGPLPSARERVPCRRKCDNRISMVPTLSCPFRAPSGQYHFFTIDYPGRRSRLAWAGLSRAFGPEERRSCSGVNRIQLTIGCPNSSAGRMPALRAPESALEQQGESP